MPRLLLPFFATALVWQLSAAGVDYQRQVRPILSDNCYLCHGPDKGTRMANLRLDVHEGALALRKNGAPIVPGKPDESLLIKRIYSENAGYRMPPTFSHKTLTPEQKDILRRWIAEGAPWTQHWSFVAPVKAPLPEVKHADWPRNEIDRFILAKLESAGLTPAPEADNRTLIRRVTLDLTGLPPTPAEVSAFLADRSPEAYEHVVDRLLASPHYGEHRAHYWLDAARYADTNGLHFDNYREIWPYRDWVINAFNRNQPFDQFTVEQLAGDLLPNPTLDQRVATGFQRCMVTTNEGGVILPEVEATYAKDRADTTGAVWMGLTVGCATCHDHKFDPITQKDFYSLTSFFRNTKQPIMDLNIHDTPPAVHVPLAADRAEWQQLTDRHQRLQEQYAGEQAKAVQAIGEWLNQRSAQPPQDQVYAASVAEAVTVKSAGQEQSVALPSDVTTVPVEPAATRAVSFGQTGALTLPSISSFDTDKPFTLAFWFYLPDTKQNGTVLSQMDKGRGIVVRIDRGNLGAYDYAPTVYFSGPNGKTISARPLPDYKFPLNRWYHLTVAYDGTGVGRGITLFVNGAPVSSVGRPEDVPRLTGSLHSSAPLLLGSDGKQHFQGGGVADVRVWSRLALPADAQRLMLASRADAARAKPLDQLSDEDKQALAALYAPISANSHLAQTEQALYRIQRRAPTTLVMEERTDAQPVAHVLYRGQYDQMRDEVQPRTPSVLPPMSHDMPRNRLGLAKWIVDPANPLTARVTVNRFWQELFGTGLVRTVEDFGSQGEPPSHPELLDWLAVDFRDSGWDVKRTFKLMVMSAAYRQSAVSTPEKNAADPMNRLLARGPRFRMDAEMVRDYALATSGLLRPDIGGPSAKPYQPSRIWETVAMEQSNTRTYQPDTGDNLYRRSLYTFWKRAAPPPSMDIFNAPSRETCTVKRERTNTPLQALVTMNDVQFVEAARILAQNAMRANGRVDKQLSYLSDRLLARPLQPREAELLTRSYNDFLSHYAQTPDDAAKLLKVGAAPEDPKLPAPKAAALTMVANAMLNLDETLVK